MCVCLYERVVVIQSSPTHPPEVVEMYAHMPAYAAGAGPTGATPS